MMAKTTVTISWTEEMLSEIVARNGGTIGETIVSLEHNERILAAKQGRNMPAHAREETRIRINRVRRLLHLLRCRAKNGRPIIPRKRKAKK